MTTTTTTTTCNICGGAKDKPYRRYDSDGNITEGCVAKDHNGAALGAEDAAWHRRQDARIIRASTGWTLVNNDYVAEASDFGPQGPTHCPACAATLLRHLDAQRNAEGELTKWTGTCNGKRITVYND